ncbi:terminase small subunit [Orbus wheelerorum]|uniref:terminase small subunit n=1 Tax=Orbus wheelerorum TaxID=3074111 RepID=UPI00370DC408
MTGRKSNLDTRLKKANEYVNHGYKENGGLIPSISGLSLYIGCSRSSLYNYAHESEEFSDLLETVKAIQENELINKGLSGEFNATITKLMLANHGYSDKQQVEQNNHVRVDFNKPLSALFEDD